MRTVIFKTENAQFQFDKKDINERLDILKTKYGVDDALTLLKRLKIPSVDPLTIHEEHDYFGYIVLDLIAAGKSSVTCEVCVKKYKANQLKPISVGHGKSPFDVNPKMRGGAKRLFGNKRKLPLFGGKGYECPAGHELISMITWRT